MKKILSTVLALCMILGCVAVGFTAQAAKIGDQLQSEINAAINGSGELNWTKGDVELTAPITINGDVKINFNGATILGAPHKNTIVINGGNVELIDADIEGTGAKYHYIPAFIDEVKDACPTILIGNANVTMTNLVVTGAYIRIVGTDPNTGEQIPMSDAITMGNANGVLTLNNVRAFGNNGVENLNGAKVNVTEALVGGYINDFYNDKNVTYAAGTTQYSGYDLFVEALNDQVTLTEGEVELISKVLGRWFEVTASVENQNYVEPTYDYDADTDTLKVTATADKKFGDTKIQNQFDYLYVPKTATILGVTKDFVNNGDYTYTATFENIGPDTVCDTDLVYKLALDLAEDAQAAVDELYGMVDEVVASLPAVLEKFAGEQNDAIDKYLTGEQSIPMIIWNLYNDHETNLGDDEHPVYPYEAFLASFPEEERAAADDDVKAFLGVIFDICGASLKGDDRLNSALAAVAAGTASTAQTNNARNIVTAINNTYGAHLDYTTGAKGYVSRYLEYFNAVKNLAVQNGQYNDIKGLGEYIGANYEEFYAFLKEMGNRAKDIAAMLNDPDNHLMALLESADVDISEYTGLIGDVSGYIDMAFNYADRLFATATYQNMKAKYGDKVPQYCGIYAEKAYTIATNLDTYFPIETDGTYVEGFEFPQFATYTTPAEVQELTVTVNVSGFGKYAVEGNEYTSTQVFSVPMGGSFTVDPVEMGDDELFNYYAISDANGNDRLSPTGGSLTVYSNTIITLYFINDIEVPEVVFMTNYELSNKWLDTIVAGEIDALPAVPEFEGAEFLGWATENVSGAAAQAAGILLSANEVLDMANDAEETTTFYAIYKFGEIAVSNDQLNNTQSVTDTFVANHKAYFSVLFSDKGLAAGDVIVEAGILAAGNAATIEAATPNGGAGIIKGNLDLAAYGLPTIYTYAVYFNNHSTDRTAYAKGFVIIKHANGTYSTEYTAVQSQVIAAY